MGTIVPHDLEAMETTLPDGMETFLSVFVV